MERYKLNIVYYCFKTIISLAGAFFGTIVALTLFYPLILAFPSNFVVVFFELYLLIFLAMCFGSIFSKAFANYVNYKPLFYELNPKSIFNQERFIFSFYVFGFLLFALFIKSFF